MWRRIFDVIFWIGASLYFGGMVAVGAVVAPVVFETAKRTGMSMPGIVPPLEMDRQVGGEIFGEILNRFAYVEVTCLVLLLVALAGWIIGQRVVRRSTWVILGLWVVVGAVTAYDAGWVRPRVWELRREVRENAAAHVGDTSKSQWPERVEFDALHTRSETLGKVKVYALLGMIVVAAWRGLAERRAGMRGAPHDAMWRSRKQ